MLNLCIITGSRAEYGLLKNIIIKLSEIYNVKLVVTGTHLSKIHGYTINNIKQDEIVIDYELNMLLADDNAKSISKSIGVEILGLSDYFFNNKFDYVMVLGDRYEILSAVLVATIFQIKIIHFCGGDITEGAYDNDIRHAITQLSHMHFVSCEESKQKVESFGKNNVYVVGNPGLEYLLDFKPEPKKYESYVMFVYHVETKNLENLQKDIQEIKKIFDFIIYQNVRIICVGTNADNDNSIVKNFYKEYRNDIIYYENLPRQEYLSLAYHSKIFMGNSSSGIYEIPYFNKYIINIGNRQSGRRVISNVINCNCVFEDMKDKFMTYYYRGDNRLKQEGGFPLLNTTQLVIDILNKQNN